MCAARCVIVVAFLTQASDAINFRKSNISQVPVVGQDTIFVRVIEANGLRDADWMPGAGYADSQVWCSYGTLKKRTVTVSHDTPYVKWDRILDMGPYQPGMDLIFNIHDRDLGSAYDYMGGTKVPHANYYPLSGTKGFSGQLTLSGNAWGSGSKDWATLTVGVEVLSGVLAEAAAVQSATEEAQINPAAAVPTGGGTYSELKGQRCTEDVGNYPIEGDNWRVEIEAHCTADATCAGFMIGAPGTGWSKKPQICTAAAPLTPNVEWTAYMKSTGTNSTTPPPGVAPPAAVAPVPGAPPPAAVAPITTNGTNTTTAAPTR